MNQAFSRASGYAVGVFYCRKGVPSAASESPQAALGNGFTVIIL